MKEIEELKGIDIYLLDQLFKGRIKKESNILDAGCGKGRNIHFLLKNGFSVKAIDADKSSIQELKSKYPSNSQSFSASKIEEFHSSDKFDFVICNAVLHFAKGHNDFDKMVNSLVGNLASSGKLFIRMTSDIGLEEVVRNGHDGVYTLPDGSSRYLLSRQKVDLIREKHNLQLLEPVKSVFVDGLRSMTTLVFEK